MAESRVTQEGFEVAFAPVVDARLTQIGFEIAYTTATRNLVTQLGFEVAYIPAAAGGSVPIFDQYYRRMRGRL